MSRFTNGHAKAGGRRKGAPNRGTVRARRLISEADDKEIVGKVVARAKADDPHAQALYFRYLRPPAPRLEMLFSPIEFEQPTSAQEARDAIARIVAMIARAEIDGEHGSRIIAGLGAYLDGKVAELEAKVQAMIDARKGNGADEDLSVREITPEELEARMIDISAKPEESQQRA